MTTDWECLDLALDGDEHAWRTLYDRHYGSLVRMASCITGSVETAQDLVQESFIRLLHYAIPHRNGSVQALLTTIAYHLALKENKKRRYHLDADDDEIADESPSPLESTIADETDRTLVRILAALPSHQREIIALRFFAEHSYEEIAEITGIPLGTSNHESFMPSGIVRRDYRREGFAHDTPGRRHPFEICARDAGCPR